MNSTLSFLELLANFFEFFQHKRLSSFPLFSFISKKNIVFARLNISIFSSCNARRQEQDQISYTSVQVVDLDMLGFMID